MESDSGYWFAAVWIGFLVAAAVGYAVIQIQRSVYSAYENLHYLPTYLFGRLLWRVHFKNEAPSAIQSGAILVANHRSSVDPFFVQLAARRRVHWLVAKEYCQHAVFGPVLRALQVIPTNRSGMDTAATRTAMRLTREGRLVGMFPEGKLNRTNRLLLPLRSGAALVAIRSEVPMIPLLIEGSPQGDNVWDPLFMPARVGITFGEPICSRAHEENGEDDLALSDALILKWANQLVSLANQPASTIELASKRKRRVNKDE